MRVELFTNFAEIPVQRATWNGFAQQNLTNTIFQTYEWFESWWSTFGDHHQLIFLCAFDEAGLQGFVPLMMAKNKTFSRILRFAGDENADYCDFLIRGNQIEVVDAFLKFLVSPPFQWTKLLLLNIPEYSTTTATLQTLCTGEKLTAQIKTPSPAPALSIRQHDAAALHVAQKYSILRHFRKLQKLGAVTFENLQTADEILPHLEAFFEQHVRRYAFKNEDSLFSKPENRDFYRLMVRNMSETHWPLFSLVKLNETPIAFHFGFLYNQVLLWYKPSFDVAYHEYSPGSTMIKFLIEHAVQSSCDELDFSVGEESFKSRFSTVTRFNQNVAVYRSKFTCRIFQVQQFLGVLLKQIRKTISTSNSVSKPKKPHG